jgi:hypothetical protein
MRIAPRPLFYALALELPCIMANPVKPKRLRGASDALNFVIELLWLNRDFAQGAKPRCRASDPRTSELLAGQSSGGDALTRQGPQLSFEPGEEQVSRAHNALPGKTVERHDGLANGV